MLGKIFSRQQFKIFFLFFPENSVSHFIPIVSNDDNLYEMSDPVFWKNIIHLLSAEFCPESGKGKETFGNYNKYCRIMAAHLT